MRRHSLAPTFFMLTVSGCLIAACGGGEDRPDAISNSVGDGDGGNIGVGDGDGDNIGDGDGDMGDGDMGDGDMGDGDGDMGDGDGDMGDGDGDGDGVGEPNEPGAPLVEVLVGGETTGIFADELPVTCAVAQSDEEDSLPPDAGTIAITLLDADGGEVDSGAVESGEEEGEYFSSFPISNVPAGTYRVRCTAEDSGDPAKVGLAEVEALIDRGPIIEPLDPANESFVTGSSPVNFEVRITTAALSSDDLEAEIEGVPTINIHGTELELVLKPDTDDVYWLGEDGIDLANPSNFDEEIPTGEILVTVRATNGRGVEARIDYTVTVDNDGPSVTLISPQHTDIIGEMATFVLEITDDYSGVDWNSLVLRVAGEDVGYDESSGQWELDGDRVSFSLQTSEYGGDIQLSFNVDVADNVGNLRERAGTATFRLDQFPPVLSLDPPDFRLYRVKDAMTECSHAFDPLGDALGGDAAVELGKQAFVVRGLAWDLTNQAIGQNSLYYSSIDPNSVRLWLAPGGEPLVIDDDGDDVCDGVVSTRDDVRATTLDPIAPKGTAFYGDGTNDTDSPTMSGICDYAALPVTELPDPVCTGDPEEDMTLVITHSSGNGTIPAVFGFGVSPSSIDCTGGAIEIDQTMGNDGYEGWVCLALTGQDGVGNRGVSKPIALCLDNGMGDPPACAATAPAGAPDCTDGCTPIVFPSENTITWDH